MDAGYKDYGYSDAKSESHHEYLLPALRSLLGNSGDPILDIGCGNGCITRALLNDGFNVYGVDASESGIRIAEAAAPGRFHLMNIASGALPETLAELPFKTIISTEVIGHLYNPRGLLDFSRSILQKSGGGAVGIVYALSRLF